MLVLTRRKNETIKIGDDITIIIKACIGGRVSIGIIAPKHLNIERGTYDRDAKKPRDDGKGEQ